MFGVSPRPLTTPPFSVSAVCFVILLVPCSSPGLAAMLSVLAITVPLLAFLVVVGLLYLGVKKVLFRFWRPAARAA